jgi:tetratricopeptide (TPR) repeat protein
MDIYLTIEEKYLQALDELWYGESPKALQLLNDIIINDPLYARAHYQLGKLYHDNIGDYQAAGYHFKTCAELEPQFPDVYEHYLRLLVFLNMEKQFRLVSKKALQVPGVNYASVYNLIGLFAEKKREWTEALEVYRNALLEATCKDEKDNIQENIERVKEKKRQVKKYNYELSS